MHAFDQAPEILALIETLIELCDGVICATEKVAERYGVFNANAHVCSSGIDLQAYALTRPPHDTINVGWAGRTLQYDEMRAWLAQVRGCAPVAPGGQLHLDRRAVRRRHGGVGRRGARALPLDPVGAAGSAAGRDEPVRHRVRPARQAAVAARA